MSRRPNDGTEGKDKKMTAHRRLSILAIGVGCFVLAGMVSIIQPLRDSSAQEQQEPGFLYSELATLNFRGDIAITVPNSDAPVTYDNATIGVYDGFVVVWTSTGKVELYPFSNIATNVTIAAGNVAVPVEGDAE